MPHFDYDVFLSFASLNESQARPLYELLTGSGLRVFWSDETLKQRVGVSWYKVIEASLESSKHFVLLWSPEAKSSKFVELEYNAFHAETIQDESRLLIPVIVEGYGPRHLPLFLRHFQAYSLDGDFRELITRLGGRYEPLEVENARLREELSQARSEIASLLPLKGKTDDKSVKELQSEYDSLKVLYSKLEIDSADISVKLRNKDKEAKELKKDIAQLEENLRYVKELVDEKEELLLNSKERIRSVEQQLHNKEGDAIQQNLLKEKEKLEEAIERIDKLNEELSLCNEEKEKLKLELNKVSLLDVKYSSQEAISSSTPINQSPLNEGKLILLGRGNVGKTSIVERLVYNRFDESNNKPTLGVELTEWNVLGSRGDVKLNIWDFGGQEIMHATHQFFLTERSIYIVVVQGRSDMEDTDAEYWLRMIDSFGGDSPVILVMNKICLYDDELNINDLKHRFKRISAYVRTDCKENIGFEQLKAEIEIAIERIPDIRKLIPASWIEVKEELESMDDDFISADKFREICHKNGITQDRSIKVLSWELHLLGIALNYENDSRLRETRILKPEWITDAVYKILNNKLLRANYGELKISYLHEILPEDRYPEDLYTFIIELLHQFRLIFAFPMPIEPDGSTKEPEMYLIPELLGKNEPSIVESFSPDDCLNFEYHYPILPEGIIPRFIVMSYTLTLESNYERWRHGVVVSRGDTEGLVKAILSENKIIIRIKGDSASAKIELLSIIRFDLERINKDFRDGLNIFAKVPLLNYPNFSISYQKLLAYHKTGKLEFEEFVNGDFIKINVLELLETIEYKQEASIIESSKKGLPIIFISYSHKDERLKDELDVHLKILSRQGLIDEVWHDRKIRPGEDWESEIDSYLNISDIIILLISADFMSSDYIWGVELERAIIRHNKKEAVVVPIIVRSVDWEDTKLGKIQALPKSLEPVAKWPYRDDAWTEVTKKIRELVKNKWSE